MDRPFGQRITNSLLAVFVICSIFVPARLFAGDRPDSRTCKIQQSACSVDLDNGMKLSFDILPKPVKAMTALTFIVQLERRGKAVPDASVTLDLSMPGMHMGKNSPALQHVADGRYEGKGLITRCMSGRKTWQADIAVMREQQTRSASFVFKVQ